MVAAEDLQPEGERMRKTIRWICEMLKAYPEKSRQDVIREAEVRFDLTPRECSFLDRKICEELE